MIANPHFRAAARPNGLREGRHFTLVAEHHVVGSRWAKAAVLPYEHSLRFPTGNDAAGHLDSATQEHRSVAEHPC